MSRRTSEASKAIREAWEKEQRLVCEGKGTRDWTPEQQKDILDPNKGKAYDNDGRAYEGQHMKSVAEYPELQGVSDNIQFLTHDEHLAAHKGSWQNPTNWYYNPETKDFFDFGDGNIVPCKIIQLSNPVLTMETSEVNEKSSTNENSPKIKNDEENEDTFRSKNTLNHQPNKNNQNCATVEDVTQCKKNISKPSKGESKFFKSLKKVYRFVSNHRDGIATAVIFADSMIKIGKKISSSVYSNSRNESSINNTRESDSIPTVEPDVTNQIKEDDSTPSIGLDVTDQTTDIAEKAKRASPRKHMVRPSKQHYHTKNGTIQVEKDAYPRGGGKNS